MPEGGPGKKGRRHVIEAEPLFTENDELVGYEPIPPGEVEQAAADFATVVRTIGGIVTFGAARVEVEPDVFQTKRVEFHWSSHAPAERQQAPPPPPEPIRQEVAPPEPEAEEPEPVPVVVEGAPEREPVAAE